MAIHGTMNDIVKYVAFGRSMRCALEYLERFDPAFFMDKPPGYSEKIPVRGRDIFAIHQVYATKPARQVRFESHRAYIDLQYVWEGSEVIAIAPLSGLKAVKPYHKKDDVALYEYFPATSLVMSPGTLAVLFPSDAHAPCLFYKKRGIVSKTVVKVRV